MLIRRENHPVRVTYELILDHKNAKIRIDELRDVRTVNNKPKTFSTPEPSTLLLPGALIRRVLRCVGESDITDVSFHCRNQDEGHFRWRRLLSLHPQTADNSADEISQADTCSNG